MKRAILMKVVGCFLCCFLLTMTACVSTENTSMSNISMLEGSWENNLFKLIIKEHYYISLNDNAFYGRGIITYDGSFFTMASTHAWRNNNWVEFTEAINGKCSVDGNVLIISDIAGRYSMFNGTWNKIEDINLDDINNPPEIRVENVNI